MWYIHTMEYYTAIKNDEFLSFVGTWMNLESIFLSNIRTESQTPRIFTHRWVSNNENTWTQGEEHHTSGAVGGGRGETAGGGERGRVGRDNMGRNARYSMHLK